MIPEPEIIELEKLHDAAPNLRVLQKCLAQELTKIVHSAEDLEMAEEASQILFGKGATDSLSKISEEVFLNVFEGVPQHILTLQDFEPELNIVELLAEKTTIFPSRGEARRTLKENGLSINKAKVNESFMVDKSMLIRDKYLLVQKGKKTYYLVVVQ